MSEGLVPMVTLARAPVPVAGATAVADAMVRLLLVVVVAAAAFACSCWEELCSDGIPGTRLYDFWIVDGGRLVQYLRTQRKQQLYSWGEVQQQLQS